ncbi:ArsR/SmtB family transcription factor [Proteiniclasticum ruminis]|uniref:ArsR/SmtB family transcription factor n=1 Tax=Proteiniclasticum ruminis TaxID=398199 RepID=UPI0028B1757E|nr:metalloregulator ArsR/SmtB family transcription factor [Proteiniclasticum ruminis]
MLKITKALGDQNRLRILYLLSEGELCACELEGILSMSQSNVSRHLAKLNEALVTDYRKDAKYSYYRLKRETLKSYPFISSMIESLKGEKIYEEDWKRLQEYKVKNYNCESLKENVLLFINEERIV